MRRRVLLWLGAAAPIAARAQDALDAVMRALASVRVSRARFEEAKEIAGLGGTLASAGVLSWQAPDLIERHTTEPFEEILTIRGERLTYQRPGQNIRREFALSTAPELRPLAEGLRAVLAGDLPALQRDFEVEFSGNPAAWTLRLAPRAFAARAAVQRVTFSGEGGTIRRVETVGNESTTMVVTPLP
ncbi:LolA-related protein [Roseomonas sp. CCTCC AB2023176]|uniref:LolA-related protein n=1 Tax=Roseomonas sp. CCTCC AB2023176 TaxID=3342640 RepID=UPI0035D62AA7